MNGAAPFFWDGEVVITQAVKAVSPNASQFSRLWQLRKEVLLDPFGIDHKAARQDDLNARHFGLFEGEDCLACLFLVRRSSSDMQLRQMAVRPSRQHEGLGRKLLTFAEKTAARSGYTRLFAHAREAALPFYLALDYRVVEAPFMEVGIRHRVIEKTFLELP